MKVKYFEDTDTLYIEFRAQDIFESRELDENKIMDLDSDGNVCAIAFEHASARTDIHEVSVERVAA